jgi:uncharacterized protein YhaN
MDPIYYCDSVFSEMVALKARLYDMFRAYDQLPEAERKALTPTTSEIHAMVKDISSQLDRLRRECPTEFSSVQNEITMKKDALDKKIRSFEMTQLKSM